jgi:Ca2+-binding RTX toxin-like protein
MQKPVSFADQLYGLDGDDRLYGEGGDDLLEGALGNDQLNGGPDDHRMEGGLDRVDGNDIIANEGDSMRASDLATGTAPVFNCEKIIVDGTVVVVVVYTLRTLALTTP